MIACIQHIDILDCPADALIYSTNVLLNCSGGVGACLLGRYGGEVQKDLHSFLDKRGIRHLERGTVLQHVTTGMPYQKVFHTVPCDGFYETTKEIIADILRQSLQECVDGGAVRTIAMSALATGYGHLGYEEFFRIATSVLAEEAFASLELVTICIEDDYSFKLASEQIRDEGLRLLIAGLG